MKKILLLLFLYTTSLLSIDISSENLSKLMDREGEDRIKAIWLSYQTKQYFLLRKAAKYLLESNNPFEHKIILRVFSLLDKDLESFLPNWYLYIDQYINNKKNKEVLLDCLKLAKNWKEQRLIFSLIKLTKHPDYQIRKEAILTLNELNSDVVLPIIIEYLKSNNELLILYGLENSFYYNDKRLIPFIRELTFHSNKTIRIYAIKALSNYENESYYIIRNFDKEEDEEVLETMIELIAEKKWYNYAYLVNNTINHKNKRLRLASIKAARELKNTYFANTISKQLLIEDDEEIIKEGILSLMELDKGDSYRSLVFLLNHENKEIRLLALKAIQKLQILNYNESLISFINTEKDPEVHLELIYTICYLTNTKNYNQLIDLLENPFITKKEKYLIITTLNQYLEKSTFNLLARKNKIQLF
ncbi:MAG: hypothetical protein KatS3mg129_1401 [Leptospiraceae bacterium]|nr:MAG: hypothetical protein KatS3mg129_1401 [Leptospiraceae bacterium]